jgi:hypothetical protein
MYQHFLFQGPPRYTQIGIYGLKINHLATLPELWKKEILRAYLMKYSKAGYQTHFYRPNGVVQWSSSPPTWVRIPPGREDFRTSNIAMLFFATLFVLLLRVFE